MVLEPNFCFDYAYNAQDVAQGYPLAANVDISL